LTICGAGCLGYDVLDFIFNRVQILSEVSVAGCLGYDVLEAGKDD
jgi:hypothetical protein